MGTSGGGGRIALLLHQALRKLGMDSHLVVLDLNPVEDAFVHGPEGPFRKLIGRYLRNIDKLPNKLYHHKLNTAWSNNWAPVYTARQVLALQPDVVHLHVIGAGVFPIHDFRKLKSPIVWTMHDMMAFTGGCHYSNGCTRFLQGCGSCPELESIDVRDLSRRNWSKKEAAWTSLNMTIVSPSHWMDSLSKSSRLLEGKRHVLIHNGIDLECFRPHDSNSARDAMGLPKDKKLIGFGASLVQDPRKGLHHLQDALRSRIQRFKERGCEVVTFGLGSAGQELEGMKVHNFGVISDPRQLSLLYAALDVFCVPSIEENLATTAIESLACGTPVVAFRIGGFPDIIDHLSCGFLAEPFDQENLAQGIQFVLFGQEQPSSPMRLREASRKKAEMTFEGRKIAEQHRDLYRSVIEGAFIERGLHG
ncbi:MAG: glycosyltransferase [Terracidiphilus sp.]